MKFSTLNESSLHHTLKVMYSELYDGRTEVEANGYVYDIVTKNGNVIEIQTKNLSKLSAKIKETLAKGMDVKIVYPNVIKTSIELYDDKNSLISKRTSPKKGCIYDIFKELTGIYTLLLDSHFSLEIIQINMIEKRTRTDTPVQSKNGRRRFKKNWIKTDKILSDILGTRTFNNASDYLRLLPQSLPDEFCAKDLGNILRQDKTLPARTSSNPHIIIWVLSRMNLITHTFTRNKSRYYTIHLQ